MATRATETVDTDGLTATYHAASGGGDKVTPGAGVAIHVKNGSGGSINVTLATPGTVDALAIADRVVAVGAGAEGFIAVPELYRNPTDGLADITWSATTTITFAVIRIN
ncbi:MAG: hypothetical protein M3460_04540 [Actinomycetota bacterium]|nr:hypothetical protein [Actinomycetota bacterium]